MFGPKRRYRIEDFLKDLSSDDRLPGSGAAAGAAGYGHAEYVVID
jgi:hypothetical protein